MHEIYNNIDKQDSSSLGSSAQLQQQQETGSIISESKWNFNLPVNLQRISYNVLPHICFRVITHHVWCYIPGINTDLSTDRYPRISLTGHQFCNGHKTPTILYTYVQSFNFRPIIVPEISFHKGSVTYNQPPSQPATRSSTHTISSIWHPRASAALRNKSLNSASVSFSTETTLLLSAPFRFRPNL